MPHTIVPQSELNAKLRAYVTAYRPDDQAFIETIRGQCHGLSVLWGYAMWQSLHRDPEPGRADDIVWLIDSYETIMKADLSHPLNPQEQQCFEIFLNHLVLYHSHPSVEKMFGHQSHIIESMLEDNKGRRAVREFCLVGAVDNNFESFSRLIEKTVLPGKMVFLESLGHSMGICRGKNGQLYFFDSNQEYRGDVKDVNLFLTSVEEIYALFSYYAKTGEAHDILALRVKSFQIGETQHVSQYPNLESVLSQKTLDVENWASLVRSSIFLKSDESHVYLFDHKPETVPPQIWEELIACSIRRDNLAWCGCLLDEAPLNAVMWGNLIKTCIWEGKTEPQTLLLAHQPEEVTPQIWEDLIDCSIRHNNLAWCECLLDRAPLDAAMWSGLVRTCIWNGQSEPRTLLFKHQPEEVASQIWKDLIACSMRHDNLLWCDCLLKSTSLDATMWSDLIETCIWKGKTEPQTLLLAHRPKEVAPQIWEDLIAHSIRNDNLAWCECLLNGTSLDATMWSNLIKTCIINKKLEPQALLFKHQPKEVAPQIWEDLIAYSIRHDNLVWRDHLLHNISLDVAMWSGLVRTCIWNGQPEPQTLLLAHQPKEVPPSVWKDLVDDSIQQDNLPLFSPLLHHISLDPKTWKELALSSMKGSCLSSLQCLIDTHPAIMVEACSLEIVNFAIRNQCFSVVQKHLDTPDRHGWTMLMHVAAAGAESTASGQLDPLSWMIENKVITDDQVLTKNEAGANVLHCAVSGKATLETIGRLLDNFNIDVNKSVASGTTLLHLAIISEGRREESREALIQLLVNKGARLDVCDHNGLTPLQLAIQSKRESCVKLLTDLEVDASLTDQKQPLARAGTLGPTVSSKERSHVVSTLSRKRSSTHAGGVESAVPSQERGNVASDLIQILDRHKELIGNTEQESRPWLSRKTTAQEKEFIQGIRQRIHELRNAGEGVYPTCHQALSHQLMAAHFHVLGKQATEMSTDKTVALQSITEQLIPLVFSTEEGLLDAFAWTLNKECVETRNVPGQLKRAVQAFVKEPSKQNFTQLHQSLGKLSQDHPKFNRQSGSEKLMCKQLQHSMDCLHDLFDVAARATFREQPRV